MRPAFSTTKEAGLFAGVLLALLASPWLSARHLLPQPALGYSSESVRWERYPWVQDFIYEEKGDIDIAFVGSSHLLYGIDTPFVQRQLDEETGRATVVRSVCWKGSGFDSLYFFTKELLARRRVKTLVFYDEAACEAPDQVQQYAATWFRWGEYHSDIAPLPLQTRIVYYFAAVIGLPRNALAILTPNLPLDRERTPDSFLHWEPSYPETRLGSVSTHFSYDPKRRKKSDRFVPYAPDNAATNADVEVVPPHPASSFAFVGQPLAEFQTHFARQFGRLAHEKGCRLILLHPPTWDQRAAPAISESRNWGDLMEVPVTMIGIPPARMFAGLTDVEIAQLFFDPAHMNANGQRYFTALITPALLEAHADDEPR